MGEKMTESYNDYLYRLRREHGYRRRDVARAIGVSRFMYHRYERGYSAPSEKVIPKISEFYGEDFREHFEGAAAYPAEISRKENSGFREWLKKALAKTWIKIVAIVAAVLGVLTIPASLIVDHYVDPAAYPIYSSVYSDLQKKVVENGQRYIDPLGNFNKRIYTDIYSDEGFNINVSVRAPVNPTNLDDMSFHFIYRQTILTDDNPYVFRMDYVHGSEYVYTITNTATGEYTVQTGTRAGLDDFKTKSTRSYTLEEIVDHDVFDYISVDIIATIGDVFFTIMVNDLLGTANPEDIDSFYENILTAKEKGDQIMTEGIIATSVLSFGAIPFGLMVTVLVILAFVFTYEREEPIAVIERGEQPLPPNRRLPLFMGASALRIIGSVLLLLGSTYVLLSLANQFGMISLVVKRINGTALLSISNNLFFLGVFFLYIIGLSDDFAHPMRLYRRTLLFGGVSFAISTVQSLFVMQMNYLENGFVNVLLRYLPPNVFVLVFLFHLCAMFLFATPYFIKGRGIKVWRSMSLLPVLFSTGVFIADVIFRVRTGEGIEHLSYFLGANRFPYAITTYCFLFGNFFIRRNYAKRYGEPYLRGDTYSFVKNLTLCIPAFILGAIELALAFNVGTRSLGFGTSYSLLLVAILMLFHRGQNEKHHLWALVTARAFYAIGLFLTYALSIGLAALYIISF